MSVIPLARATRSRHPAVTAPDAAHFAAPVCHNCSAALHTPCCAQCGQERARRVGGSEVGHDFWDEWGLFGTDVVVSAGRLMRRPGVVAREYVFGARKRHVNPFKLLLIGIAALVVVVERGNYLASANAPVSQAMAIVRSWANLSFSLGVLAMVLTTWLFYRQRGGFNLVEHLVLACYLQFVLVVISVLTKLPTLIWTDPAFLASHRVLSGCLLDISGFLVFFSACRQFFVLELRCGWFRLLCASAFFLGCKWILVRIYALLLIRIVLSDL